MQQVHGQEEALSTTSNDFCKKKLPYSNMIGIQGQHISLPALVISGQSFEKRYIHKCPKFCCVLHLQIEQFYHTILKREAERKDEEAARLSPEEFAFAKELVSAQMQFISHHISPLCLLNHLFICDVFRRGQTDCVFLQ